MSGLLFCSACRGRITKRSAPWAGTEKAHARAMYAGMVAGATAVLKEDPERLRARMRAAALKRWEGKSQAEKDAHVAMMRSKITWAHTRLGRIKMDPRQWRMVEGEIVPLDPSVLEMLRPTSSS
ncbi:MAG: hypothetical protein QG615_1765 [Nitrospirota bacterium]|nr:hypothetical protein [Nitrospirota bacterium]